jgi:hypothetical protein
MSLNAWLSLSFTVPAFVAYSLWCAERMPRLRSFIGVVGVLAFVAALVIDGFFE